jgi:hypothetical protein
MSDFLSGVIVYAFSLMPADEAKRPVCIEKRDGMQTGFVTYAFSKRIPPAESASSAGVFSHLFPVHDNIVALC